MTSSKTCDPDAGGGQTDCAKPGEGAWWRVHIPLAAVFGLTVVGWPGISGEDFAVYVGKDEVMITLKPLNRVPDNTVSVLMLPTLLTLALTDNAATDTRV